MRFSGIRLPLLAAVVCASVGLSLWTTDRSYGQAIYVYPTSTTIPLSTPYVLPRAYVLPSSYMFPNYIESAYTVEPVSLLRTGYIETTYRRGLFGRRWVVERPVIASYASAYLPTSYLSAYVPTTYSYMPTTYSYMPTTYVAPSYYATTYRVGRYRPTSWTYPTVWETAISSSADICCDEVVLDSPVRSAPQSSVAAPGPSSGSKEVESAWRGEDPTIPSNVDVPLPEEPGGARRTLQDTARTKAQTKTDTNRADSPPNPPAPGSGFDDAEVKATPRGQAAAAGNQKNAGTPKSTADPASKAKTSTPAAPAGDANDIELQPAPGTKVDETLRRDSQRPVYATRSRVDRRNILFGTVETDNGDPRGEVPVTVTNRNNSALQHNGVSNAFGGFAIRVPDGQWTVKVTMPSGSVQKVRDITVTSGKVMDNLEAREVYNLIISY